MTAPVASFRDPAGRCCLVNERILRLLDPQSAADCLEFLFCQSAQAFTASRQLVSTRQLRKSELAPLRGNPKLGALFEAGDTEVVLEHERIEFPSYPYEWAPEMLAEAGRLTLDLAEAALEEGFGLKDATPYNVLFRGAEPVFVDVASFERRVPGDPVWRPYGQFVRSFLLPLLAHRHWGVRLADIFTSRRDGIEPQEVYRFCSFLERFKPRILTLVSMPTWLRSKARADGEALYLPRRLADAEKARFIVQSLFRQCRRALEALVPSARSHDASVWSNYMESHSYNQQAFAAKERFVQDALREFKPARVLDVGANTGHFSVLAAESGAQVVAIDLDPVCVGAIWQRARRQRLNILPLVLDLARPSPALGWQNCECPSFLERAQGNFEGVLMLAVLHHLLVTERIPLAEILRAASLLTSDLLIIEFVGPEDEMFRHLTRGREHLHTGLSEASFEEACRAHFDLVRSIPLPGIQRRLYALKRKGGPG